MAKRLVKVAKELNVGTTTIVEHLNKSGFDVENKPTAKLTDEMYNNLISEFSGSIAIKEQADLLTIGTRKPKEKQEEVVPEVVSAPVPVVEPAPEVVEPVVEEVVVEEAPVVVPEVVEAPPVVVEVKEVPPAPVEEVVVVPEEVTIPEEVISPIMEEEVVQVAPAKKKEVVQEPVPEQKTKRKEKKEDFVGTPKLDGLKVIDKVDLNELKQRNKKKGKKKQASPPPKVTQTSKPVKANNPPPKATPPPQPAKPKEVVAKANVPAPTKPPRKENEIYRAETPTLKGVKVFGKIDISKFAKKPSSKKKKDNKKAESGDKNKNKQGQGQAKPKPKTGETGDSNARKRRRKRKKVTTEGTGNAAKKKGSGNNNNRRGGGRENKEISKKEVDDKLKATMARLQGGGKNRRSKIRRSDRERRREKEQEAMDQEAAQGGKLQVTEFISVSDLASLMDVSATEVIMACMNMGVMVAINQRLDAEIIELVAEEFKHEVEFISAEAQMEMEEEEVVDAAEDLKPRAPIVTVMGHVDHGKTSLLDHIRNANVIAGEAGGITQHIGAYEVKVGDDDRRITFLDTPGHEAFTAMRARGAKVTDVAVIIVAADDSVMPQTKEAISHAQAAGVPIIFAINKIDKDGSNPERIKQELASMNMLVEDWGGKFPSQEISAKEGTNVDELLEKIILESDILELKANPDRHAQGVVLEASLDKGRGYVSKFLVQAGTLKIGDPIVAGSHYGKVRAMINERGQRVEQAGPSAPVLVLGMKGAPQAGEKFKVFATEQETRQLATKRAQIQSEQDRRATKRLSLEEIGRRLALGSFKELNLIVKGDVDGSIEALADSLLKLSTETVQVNIVHKAVGQIIESDILLASASDAIIVGFQVRPSAVARKLAEKEGVQIKTYSVIYAAIEEIKLAIEGMLEPTREEKVVGSVEIREVYKISKVGTVAGCYVQEGKMTRNTHIRIIRDGIVVYPIKEGVVGELASLKRYKDDIKEVKNGMECGITIKNFNDLKPEDIIEGYEIIEIKQKL